MQRFLLRRLDRRISQLSDQMNLIIARTHFTCPNVPNTSNHGGPPGIAPINPSPAGSDSAHVGPSIGSCIPREAIPSENLKILVLPNRTEIPYDKTVAVRAPPGKHFSGSRLPDLFEHWESSTLATLNGYGIPVKYWPLLFKARSLGVPGQWDALKKEWNNWKVRTWLHIWHRANPLISSTGCAQFIVEEKEHLGSAEAFWVKFADPEDTTKRLGYQAILDKLQDERKERDMKDFTDAMICYDRNLANAGSKFMWKGKVMSKTVVIAKKWRELLEDDPTLAVIVNDKKVAMGVVNDN